MTTTIRNVTLSVPPDEIDDLCAAHAALDFSPSLELGSEKSGAGAPRFGSVTNLRNAGGKLTVDLEVADERVAKAILAKGPAVCAARSMSTCDAARRSSAARSSPCR